MAVVIVRTLIIYFSLLLTMRVLGKRQLGEMELSEFVVAALIADLAAAPLQDMGIPLINGLVPIVILSCCEILISGISMKSIRIRGLLFGKPSILISQGKINQAEMRRNRFTSDELMEALRMQGYTDIEKITYAVLETNGQLNIILSASEQPVTAAQMGLAVPEAAYPSIIINSGRVLDTNLSHLGFDRAWLQDQLHKHSLAKAEDVYLMTADTAGKIYLAAKEVES